MSWTPDSIPDQSGRLAVVTGANSGIGYVTARELARRGAHVVLACRSRERGQEAVERLRAEAPDARTELRMLDLADLSSVRSFAADWSHDRLDLLVNNAGVAMVPFSRTADGFESQFGINHLGTFALTGLLMPHLLAAADPRVVTVSSEGQRFARFDLTNLNAEHRYRTAFAYVQSKRANLYFATELQRRADTAGLRLRSMAVAPDSPAPTCSPAAPTAPGVAYTVSSRVCSCASPSAPHQTAPGLPCTPQPSPTCPGEATSCPMARSSSAANPSSAAGNAPSRTPLRPANCGGSRNSSPACTTHCPQNLLLRQRHGSPTGGAQRAGVSWRRRLG